MEMKAHQGMTGQVDFDQCLQCRDEQMCQHMSNVNNGCCHARARFIHPCAHLPEGMTELTILRRILSISLLAIAPRNGTVRRQAIWEKATHRKLPKTRNFHIQEAWRSSLLWENHFQSRNPQFDDELLTVPKSG
jgi:hypothetical protein